MSRSAISGSYAAAITPSDSANFAQGVAVGLYVGVTGDVTLVNENGDTCLFKSVPAGKDIPCTCKRVNATGTAASSIVAYF